jgi:hypothetical protein
LSTLKPGWASSDAEFNAVASYLADDAARFVAEVESIEL